MPKKVVMRTGVEKTLYTQSLILQTDDAVKDMTFEQMTALCADERRRTKFVSDFKKNVRMGKLGIGSRNLKHLREDCFPGLTRPDSDVRKAREQQRVDLVTKMAERNLLIEMHMKLARGNNRYQVPRYVLVLMDTSDFSPETLEKNRRTFEAFRPDATVEEQAAVILPLLKQAAEYDFEHMNLADPQYVTEHAADLMLFSGMAGEAEKYAELLQKLGVDKASDPELKKVVENFELIHEVGMYVPVCFDLICSDLYPEIGFIDNELVSQADLDRDIVRDKEKTTPRELYLDDYEFSALDASANSLLQVLSNLRDIPSPLLDTSVPPEERVRRVKEESAPNAMLDFGINLRFRKEEAVEGVAPEKNYDFEHGLPAIEDEETRVIVNHISFDTHAVSGKASYTVPIFHPCLPEDAKRVYVKNNEGVYVRAFPEADRADFTGLTAQQLKDIYTTDKKYAYFPAGSTEAMYFSDGALHEQAAHYDNDRRDAVTRPAYKINFGYEGNCRINGWMSENAKKALANEEERRQCDVFVLEQKRVQELFGQVFGNECNDEGTEASRVFGQAMVHTLREKNRALHPNGGDSITYPPLDKNMTEDDIMAVTLLACAAPSVNGKNMPGLEEATSFAGYTMASGDMFIQRGSTPDSPLMDWVMNARMKVKPALTAYYQNNNPDDMVDLMLDGMKILSAMMNVPPQLTGNTLACFVPSVKVCGLLENHPGLLTVLREKAARENKLDELNMQLENISIQRGLYNTVLDAQKAQHRLADYEAGLLRSPEGQLLKPSEAEKDALKLSRQTAQFLEEASAAYRKVLDNATMQSVEEQVISYTTRFMNDKTLSAADRQLAIQNSQESAMLLQNNHPNAPALRLAYADNGGMALVQDAIRTAGPNAKTEDILGILIDEGLIPADGVKEKDFDYAAAARDYGRLRNMKYGVNDMRRLAGEEGITVERWRQLTLSEADMKADGIRAEAAKTVRDWHMTYDDVRAAAGDSNITVREYCENVAAAVQQLADAGTLREVREYAAQRGITCAAYIKASEELGLDAAGYGEYLLYEKQCDAVGIGHEAGHVAKELGLTLDEVVELAGARSMTVAEYGEMIVEENSFAQSGITAAARNAVKELGLSYADVTTLAETQGITVAEYGNRVLEQMRQAERPTVVRTRLTGVEYQLDTPEIADTLTGSDYCRLMKELNSISESHTQDLYTVFRSGELMNSLYLKMRQYEEQHPEFAREKQQLLKPEDFNKAKDTVQRGVRAGKQLKDGQQPAPEEAKLAAPGHGLVK